VSNRPVVVGLAVVLLSFAAMDVGAQGVRSRSLTGTAVVRAVSLADQVRAKAASLAMAQSTARIPVPGAEQESWAKRHPVLMGTLSGLAVGGIFVGAGASGGWVSPGGVAFVLGIGAGAGALIGWAGS